MDSELDRVVAEVVRGRKYRRVCAETARRVSERMVGTSSSGKDAVKRTRRKLHQVCGAYMEPWNQRTVDELLDALRPGADVEAVKSICRGVMAHHASTRERLPFLDDFYDPIWAATGVPSRVLDLGCGLHPFALPWMGLPANIEYEAWDMDGRMTDAVGAFFERLDGQKSAHCRDLSQAGQAARADVALLLKMIPCLEQQEKGWGVRLLRALPARCAVVSFPSASLSGKNKGMPAHYAGLMSSVSERAEMRCEVVMTNPELVAVFHRR